MVQISRAFESVLNKQYPCPKGVIGRFAGELMVRQHIKETVWTVSIADIQPADRVLEIGFGAGRAIELLAEKTTRGSVAGIDLSPTMVKRARVRNAQAIRAGRVALQQGDAAQLPFAAQQFDKVVTIHTMYFWSDPEAILTEILRVLKPGGGFVSTLATDLQLIEEQVLPGMKNIGFMKVSSKEGPIVRGYKIFAVIGAKPSDS